MEFATRSKIKNVQIKYQVFSPPKNGLRRPWGCAYFIFYLNEGSILLIFKYLRPVIFWKTRGILFREKHINPVQFSSSKNLKWNIY
jgi:hypothetical protein